jgi:hypothetical protein
MKSRTLILIIGVSSLLFILIWIFAFPWKISEEYASARIRFKSANVHTPTLELRRKWNEIEEMLIQKDAKTVKSIDTLLSDLVKQENDITMLLEQKASTQMGCISILISIILASLNFFIKGKNKFSFKWTILIFFIIFCILSVFIISMYFSYQGFAIKENFASYNVDDLFNIMKDEKSDLNSFWTSNILENYQIYLLNSKANEYKAQYLLLAARYFIGGVIAFTIFVLIMMFIRMRNISFRREVISNGKEKK